MKETRETELPSLYEPLVLNCDLLLALAEEMQISYSEKAEIEAILQTDKNGVFLIKPINDRYSFSVATEDYNIDFSKDKLVIPVELLTAEAEIVVTVTDSGKTTTFEDCTITKVERKDDSISSFYAHVSSEETKDYGWTENSKVTVKIINGDKDNPIIFRYKVAEYDDRRSAALVPGRYPGHAPGPEGLEMPTL